MVQPSAYWLTQMTDNRKMFQVVKWHFVEFLIDIQHFIVRLIFNVGTLVIQHIIEWLFFKVWKLVGIREQ